MNPAPSQLDTVSCEHPDDRRLAYCTLIAVLAWCALPLSPPHADSDFWGHVQYGLDAWHHGLDRTSTYTYNALGYRWINHENLSELLFAALTRHGNGAYLLTFKCLLGLTLLCLAAFQARRERATTIATATCLVVASLNLSFYWGVRPHLLSFFFFGLLIAFTDWAFQGWSGKWHGPSFSRRDLAARKQWESLGPTTSHFDSRRLRWLWLVPILLTLWTNTHGGFLAGLAVAVSILLLRAAELVFELGTGGWKHARTLVIIAMATVGATLINPYGIELHLWLIESLRVPRPEILEWHPPAWFATGSGKLWLLVGLILTGWLGSRRPRDLTRLIVFMLVSSQALKHQRHIPFVAILFMFWMPGHLTSLAQRIRRWSGSENTLVPASSWSPSVVRLACLVLLGLSGLFLSRVVPRLRMIPVDRNVYPVAAVQYIADQSLTGRMVTTGQWAQYVLGVIGARQPSDSGVQVAFDGRFRTCYPQEIVDLHFDFFIGPGEPDKRYRSPHSPPVEPLRLLSHNRPNLALINRQQPRQVTAMQSVQGQWVLLYQDSLAQLWGRRSIYDDRALATYLPHEQRIVDGGPQTGAVPFPGEPISLPMQTQHVRTLRNSREI